MMDDNKPQFVKVPLGDILPNPFRKIADYPLNPEKIQNLRKSIEATGFWKNVIVRPSPSQPGRYELAYGHHRIAAAIEELGKDYEHHFPVEDYDDYMMMLVLTHENSDDWSSPVEHWMLAVDVARDWLEASLGRDGDAIEREITHGYASDERKLSKHLQEFSPEARIFVVLYVNKSRALTALHTCRERGVEAIHVAQFLGERFVSICASKQSGYLNHTPSIVIARAFDLLPLSAKRAAYLRAETQRQTRARLDLEEETRKAEAERCDRERREWEARRQSCAEQQKQREAGDRRRQEEAKAAAALRAQEEAEHEDERRIAEAERQMALTRVKQAAEEQAHREHLRQEAHEQARTERNAKEELERRLKYLKEKQDREERLRSREQANFERLQQDGQVDPEAIQLCKTWVLAAAFRDKVLDPHVQQYLTKDRQKDLLLDIMATKGERLTPDVLVREIDVRIGRVERVVAEQAELGTRIERAADDVAVKVRSTRRAFDILRSLVEQARQERNQTAMVAAIAAISQANFAEIVRSIDDLRKDAEALAGIASPRPSNGQAPDVSPPDYPSLTLVAG